MVALGPHPLSIWTPNYEAMNQIPLGSGGGKRRAKGQTEYEEEGRAIHLRNGKRKSGETWEWEH